MHLAAQTAQDLMQVGDYCVPSDVKFDQLAQFMTDRAITATVIVDQQGRPLGVVTISDMLVHQRESAGGGQRNVNICDIMTPGVFVVTTQTRVEEVVDRFNQLNVHHLFVIDQHNQICGLITTADLVSKLRS